jgi:hypothetical protein
MFSAPPGLMHALMLAGWLPEVCGAHLLKGAPDAVPWETSSPLQTGRPSGWELRTNARMREVLEACHQGLGLRL